MFGHSALPSKIFRYHVRAPINAGRAWTHLPEIQAQLSAAHCYRNALVAVELDRRGALAAVLDDDEAVQVWNRAVTRVEEAIATEERAILAKNAEERRRALHDLLIVAVSALCRESGPCPRERWLVDGNLRVRLTPMEAGWQRIDVFDVTQLPVIGRLQVEEMSIQDRVHPG